MSERIQRIEFTKEMKETYTILFPNMVHIHFQLLQKILRSYGYKAQLLNNMEHQVVEEGLKYVHNDTCYPALLTIGQMIDALKNSGLDTHKVALAITQTGGGCRASNYIYLLRKALVQAGFEYVPVISLNMNGMEKNSGFSLTPALLQRMLCAMAYGDLLMLLSNQRRPYEVKKGESDALVEKWVDKLCAQFEAGEGMGFRATRKNMEEIRDEFSDIIHVTTPKVKVGIVGEIYAKYSPLANNHLEEFLASQDCEVMVPGILQFLLYAMDMPAQDISMYGGNKIKKKIYELVFMYLQKYESILIETVQDSEFTAPSSYKHLKTLASDFIGTGCKMGEGFLLTAEMIELTLAGYENIVCAQPFGCLPNHIAGKAMMSKIKKKYPQSNIVAIDYDASATKVNQENRIKLMLSIARENLQKPKDPENMESYERSWQKELKRA
jgi:predicted nucleotide-binding protein (sugar kinase/HSP70/actin superfamily)